MVTFSNKRYTLVLSKHFAPLAVVGAKKCMKYFLNDAKALDPVSYEQFAFEDWVTRNNGNDSSKTISTVRYYILIPEVIVLDREYIRRKDAKRALGVSKQKVFCRDEWKCGYCLNPVNSKSATIDHVVPVSKSGPNIYENVVTCCADCNTKKGDIDLEVLETQGWTLHHKLIRPTTNILDKIPKSKILDSWKPFLKSIAD
jgi:hypothetical protein